MSHLRHTTFLYSTWLHFENIYLALGYMPSKPCSLVWITQGLEGATSCSISIFASVLLCGFRTGVNLPFPVPSKINLYLVIPYLGSYPGEMKIYVHTETYTQLFIAALFIIAPNWKQPNVFSWFEYRCSRMDK